MKWRFRTSVVRMLLAATFLAALATGLGPAPSAHAASFTVNSTADAVDDLVGDGICHTAAGTCTLRAAIMEANRLAGDDTIKLPAGVYNLTIAGTNEYLAATGDLNILANLTISGAGAASTIIDAGGLDRVFLISDPSRVAISGVHLRNGHPPADQYGGAIWNMGALTLDSVMISGSTASGTGSGGGICSGCGGGGTASLILKNSTLDANAADRGGAVFSNVPLTVVNSTLTENSTRAGGAIIVYGTAAFTNVTVAGNTASQANNTGGMTVEGTATFENTIIGNNTYKNCGGSGTLNDGGNNLRYPSTDLTCVGAFGDPKLGTLMDNGGPTPTMALLAGSAAINAGESTACSMAVGAPDFGAEGKDQRGYDRRSGYCDIGAYESQPASITATGGSSQSATINTLFAAALQANVQDGTGNNLGGAVVTFEAPASGPSANLSSDTATTNSSGNASVDATANRHGGGPYQVAASAGGAGPAEFALTNTPDSTNTAANLSATSVFATQPVFITATVTSGSGTPSGDVTFRDGTSPLGQGMLDGSGQATLSTSGLAPGSHSITAVYAGDGDYAPSTSAVLSLSVNKANTITSITGHAPNPSRLGQGVTVRFTVASPIAVAGTVTVSDGAANCTATVASGSCVLTPAATGSKTLTAAFSGDANNVASNATASHSVVAASWQLFLPMLVR